MYQNSDKIKISLNRHCPLPNKTTVFVAISYGATVHVVVALNSEQCRQQCVNRHKLWFLCM